MGIRKFSVLLACAGACSTSAGGNDGTFGQTDSATDATGATDTATTTSGTSATGTGTATTSTSSGGPIFDVGMGTAGTTGPVDECKVGGDGSGVGMCDAEGPPDSFDPVVEWSWTGPGNLTASSVTPLVANLTDDNGDGEIDLCDTPDLLVNVSPTDLGNNPGRLFVIDGATGTTHFEIQQNVPFAETPAIGDVDNDGLPEIIAYDTPELNGQTYLYAFEHDGTQKWMKPLFFQPGQGSLRKSAIAIADIDNDGFANIIVERNVTDHEGNLMFTTSGASVFSATTVADLDGDGDQEIIGVNSAYDPDGILYYQVAGLGGSGYPQVADLDGDQLPEVLVLSSDGISIIEHTGVPKFLNQKPTNDPSGDPWLRPAAIHDFDADGEAEIAVSTGSQYIVWQPDLTMLWAAPVDDASGDATGTAFDFLGDGTPEAMYADENDLWAFDGNGQALLQVSRNSSTQIEYPIVADVDNDGSAEIVLPSDNSGGGNHPPIQVIGDARNRWIQARRIWNQHTYHVTNVREDGTIPQFEQPHWLQLNTFRTQAQINGSGGGVCRPEG